MKIAKAAYTIIANAIHGSMQTAPIAADGPLKATRSIESEFHLFYAV
jgi:hypothetical protein